MKRGREIAAANRAARGRRTETAGDGSLEGEVIAAYGRHYRVRVAGADWHCLTRGKKSEAACGDRVRVTPQGAIDDVPQGVVEEVRERRNLVYRSDQFRQKLLAANVDRIVIVVAAEPTFSDDLLSRALVAAESIDVPALIVFNKVELASAPVARERLASYARIGAEIVEVSLKADPQTALARLLPLLAGPAAGEAPADADSSDADSSGAEPSAVGVAARSADTSPPSPAPTNLVLGQSGMGKSTLVNLLIPGAAAATQEISERLDSGKHTTTFAQLHEAVLPDGQALRIVDSPGFQEFGLAHLTAEQIQDAFPEFRAHLGGCRFYNCRHLEEPGCAVLGALAGGDITPRRHALYRQLLSDAGLL
ncbi:ribosome small subunit-dependent GTPase A [Derxia gummosa]|uniref:Small ribosomal subunit biogenesis GTPase RsgA n=1 Tax=Derxia gummosa DSM 723 TaxID=1121388 RepID=A0A8B6X2L5_9BURK|nr:ribosome small subunit-dependent GTPase A [Derxia gummosa]